MELALLIAGYLVVGVLVGAAASADEDAPLPFVILLWPHVLAIGCLCLLAQWIGDKVRGDE